MNDPTRRHFVGELLGAGLLGAVVALVIYANKAFPGPHPVVKGPVIIIGGICFLCVSGLLIASYLIPERSVIFRFLASVWENALGPSFGRPGLLFLGGLFALLGLWIFGVGIGILG
jgi:hypothetical protein